MADVTAIVVGATTVGANYEKFAISQSDAGREFILSITTATGVLTDAKLKACVNYLTTAHGSAGAGDSAGVVASIGTADGTAYDNTADTVVFVRFQTTADFTITGVNAAATDTVVAIVAQMRPAD